MLSGTNLGGRKLQKLLGLSRIIDRFNEIIGRFSAGLVLLMILVGVWNVIGRYIGRGIGQNLTSNALIEIQWYIFDIIFLLGGAYTLKHNEHVRVDVLYSGWTPKKKALANLIGTVLFLIPFSIIIIIVSWNAVLNSWEVMEMSPDPGGLPRYPIKTMIIVSCILLVFQGISEAIKNWAIFTSQTPLQEAVDDSDISI